MIDTSGCPACITTPGSPAIPGNPGSVTYLLDMAWDAGANSIQEISGDLFLQFTVPEIIGGVIGFRTGRDLVANIPSYLHAFFFQADGPVQLFSIYEAGVQVVSPTARSLITVDEDGNPCDAFEIQRNGSSIVYIYNGVVYYHSAALSLAPFITSSCLYGSGDKIG